MGGCACSQPGVPPALENVEVVANDRVASGVGLVVLHAPRTAATVRPGQFVHLRISRESAALLRRPFSVHRVRGERIEILYQVLGTGTRLLAERGAGEEMDLIGPLGHGWEIPPGITHALLVAGGLGAAPLGMLAEELAARGVAVTVALGAPTEERLIARDLFETVARRFETATDDGSCGVEGFVTGVCESLLADEALDLVYTCGPEQMQRIVAAQAAEAGVSCQVSLERLMACGIGACLSCVVRTNEGQKRACVDGPVFDAATLLWDRSEIL
ncbi:MAG: dihydroorotate dehydrogenase electron transfer subunit [Anaerosomatales bacterium]|nr:dihydroorotate dehydrogenase electron transfer subunit [Anaerosomatales bacterium]MDT8433277.1 dihydroorotate dehydrogenase electron transfer subunit [Anaerosomatales bacterium]